jgi:hypothetical protein
MVATARCDRAGHTPPPRAQWPPSGARERASGAIRRSSAFVQGHAKRMASLIAMLTATEPDTTGSEQPRHWPIRAQQGSQRTRAEGCRHLKIGRSSADAVQHGSTAAAARTVGARHGPAASRTHGRCLLVSLPGVRDEGRTGLRWAEAFKAVRPPLTRTLTHELRPPEIPKDPLSDSHDSRPNSRS